MPVERELEGASADLRATLESTQDGILVTDAHARNFRRDLDGVLIPVDLVIALVPPGASALTFTVQSDRAAPINATATVGTRLIPPTGHEPAGYISGGKGYYPAGYLNPFSVGVEVANLGAIIPVNALSTDNLQLPAGSPMVFKVLKAAAGLSRMSFMSG